MKRFRLKAAGLGLALAAGGGFAAEGEWHAPGEPPAPVVIPAGGPGLLPASMRGTPAPAKAESPTLWFPARQPAPPALITPTGGIPEPTFDIQPQPHQQAQPQPVAVGPRANGSDPFGALPPIPALPDVPAPQPEVFTPQQDIPRPLPAVKPPSEMQPPVEKQPDPPKPADPVTPPRPADPKMVPPRAPEYLPPIWKGDPAPLQQPKPVDPQPKPQPEPELPCAPSELMYPAGALELRKHGTFGSAPLSLSRDYPPLRDLIQKGHAHDGITISDDGDEATGGPLNRYFVSGEYLLWWMPGFPTPVLATTNANTALNGFLGEPGTTALLGPGGFVGNTRSGFRVRGGAWFNDCGTCGIDGSFFFLGNRSASAAFGPGAFPLLTRPVFVPNPLPGTGAPIGENGEFVSLPGSLRGTLTASGDSELWGLDVNLRRSLCNTCNARAEVFAGYRHLDLRERLTITENITVTGTGGGRVSITDPVGTQVIVRDRFRTENQFDGAQIGGLYERRWGRWDANARASVAMGNTHQVLEVDGFQSRQRPGMPPMAFSGGLLATGPNLGRFTTNHFSFVPELTLNVGYRVTNNLRVFAGYNFLLWTNVIRPGDQIDRVVDLTFIPNVPPPVPAFSGMPHPRPLLSQRDLVINGIQFGLDWRW
jgi:hypothetical protein